MVSRALGLEQYLGVWCNWQHGGFWYLCSWFESRHPSTGVRAVERLRYPFGMTSLSRPRIAVAVNPSAAQGAHRDYGHRLVEALRQQAYAVGHKRVSRLMHEERIHGRSKRGFKPSTTDSRHYLPVASNRLARQFSIDNPTPTWVSDITYLPTREGWLYLAVVLSIQTRQILGYSLSDRMPDGLVESAFLNAWSACSTSLHRS